MRWVHPGCMDGGYHAPAASPRGGELTLAWLRWSVPSCRNGSHKVSGLHADVQGDERDFYSIVQRTTRLVWRKAGVVDSMRNPSAARWNVQLCAEVTMMVVEMSL